jgi:hypothetical protein
VWAERSRGVEAARACQGVGSGRRVRGTAREAVEGGLARWIAAESGRCAAAGSPAGRGKPHSVGPVLAPAEKPPPAPDRPLELRGNHPPAPADHRAPSRHAHPATQATCPAPSPHARPALQAIHPSGRATPHRQVPTPAHHPEPQANPPPDHATPHRQVPTPAHHPATQANQPPGRVIPHQAPAQPTRPVAHPNPPHARAAPHPRAPAAQAYRTGAQAVGRSSDQDPGVGQSRSEKRWAACGWSPGLARCPPKTPETADRPKWARRSRRSRGWVWCGGGRGWVRVRPARGRLPRGVPRPGRRSPGHHGSSNSPALAPSTKASHSDMVKTRTVSSGPVYLLLRIAT